MKKEDKEWTENTKNEISELKHIREALENEVNELKEQIIRSNATLNQTLSENRIKQNIIEAIFNSVPGLIYLYDENGKLVTWNHKHETLTGYSAKEMLGKDVMSWYEGDLESQKTIKTALEKMTSSGFAEADAFLLKKDKQRTPFHFTSVPFQFDEKTYTVGIGIDISEQKKAHERIIASEKKYRNLFNNTLNGFALHEIIKNKDGKAVDYRFLEVNPAFEKLTGLKASEIIGKPCLEVLPGTESYWIESYAKVVETGESIVFENHSSELNRDYQVTAYSNEPGTFATFFVDITDMKKTEKALRASEKKFQNIFYGHSAIKLLIDPETGNIVDANEVAADYYGWTKEEFCRLNIRQINGQQPKELAERFEQIKANTQKHSEFKHFHKDGSKSDVEVFSSLVDVGDKLMIHSIIHDISDRKRAQEALVLNEAKFRSLIDEMSDLVSIQTLVYNEAGEVIDFKITDFNPAFCKILKLTPEQIRGRMIGEFLEIKKLPYFKKFCEVALEGTVYEFEDSETFEGKSFKATAVSPIKGSFAIVARDVTEIMQSHQKLLEKNLELENYTFITSHDLRSPLVNIQGFSARLKRQTDLIGSLIEEIIPEQEKRLLIEEQINEKIPVTLDFIFNNVTKMERILNALLQVSRTGRISMHLQEIHMNELIIKVINSFNHEIQSVGAEIIVTDLPDRFGDENMMNQLFSNLIGNALKYRNPNRKIKIEINGTLSKNKTIYQIKDNGIGISPVDIQKIWNVFFRVNSKHIQGEGIGLSLVKRIVEKHKGKISVASELEVGTTFSIELLNEKFEE